MLNHLGALKITKIKPYKIYFIYKGSKYVIKEQTDDADEGERATTYLMQKVAISCNKYEMKYLSFTQDMSYIYSEMIENYRGKRGRHYIYTQIDKASFVVALYKVGLIAP